MTQGLCLGPSACAFYLSGLSCFLHYVKELELQER